MLYGSFLSAAAYALAEKIMQDGNAKHENALWQAYRTSFEEFAGQAAQLDQNGLADQWQEIEPAREAHARARDALVLALVEKNTRPGAESLHQRSVCVGV